MRPIVSMRQYAIAAGAIIAFAAGLAMPPAAQAAAILMKIGTATMHDTQTKFMEVYAKNVEKASHGQIHVELFPGSQLGSITREIEATQFGQIQAWVGPPDFLTGLEKRYQVLDAPGMFNNIGQVSRTLQDPVFKKAFLALGENKGLKAVALFLYGADGFNTKKPIHHLADLKGLKLRVASAEMQMKQADVLGATAVPLTLGDLAAAIQQGTVDGSMMPISLLAPMKFYDVAKYYFATNQAVVTSIAVLSKIWYDKLPPHLQKVLVEQGARTAKELQGWTLNFIGKQNQRWLNAGGIITKPTPAEHAKLLKMVLPIGAELTSKDPGQKRLYDILLKAARRNE